MSRSTVRIVSYNLLHGIDIQSGGAIDLARTIDVLGSLDPDVVALQEVDRHQQRSGEHDQVALLAGALGMAGVFAPALLGSPDDSWVPIDNDEDDDQAPAYGVGLLTRTPAAAIRRVRLPGGGSGSRGANASLRNPGWDREPRVALVAQVPVAATALCVTVTHLSYLPGRALRQLHVAAGLTRDADAPRMLIGDLNLPAWVVRMATAGLSHAGGQATFPSWRPRLQMHHVLHDSQMEVVTARAHPETSSDHRPLVVDLRLAT